MSSTSFYGQKHPTTFTTTSEPTPTCSSSSINNKRPATGKRLSSQGEQGKNASSKKLKFTAQSVITRLTKDDTTDCDSDNDNEEF